MNSIAIRVEGLGKQYHIGGPQKNYTRLGDQLADLLATPFRRSYRLLRGQASGAAELDETIWALRDVSFAVNHGETVGIIGRNGAGKSTLLKILSRVTEPTEGVAELRGRVGSLLEVGTGFHPELTGRENVFLNGAILGMSREEIGRKFDEIVAFAELEKFIDTPIKHYSSGMYVRLAFSVAAHLETEILIVDEVLAVGDVDFQNKSLGKIGSLSRHGRTVLFVSHNMALIQRLCQRAILIDHGFIIADSSSQSAVDRYLQTLSRSQSVSLSEREDRSGRGEARIIYVELRGGNEHTPTVLKTGAPATFTFTINQALPGMRCEAFILDNGGQRLAHLVSERRSPTDLYSGPQEIVFTCTIDRLLLLPGRYRLNAMVVGDDRMQDFVESVAVFNVGEGHSEGVPSSRDPSYRIYMPHHWRMTQRPVQ